MIEIKLFKNYTIEGNQLKFNNEFINKGNITIDTEVFIEVVKQLEDVHKDCVVIEGDSYKKILKENKLVDYYYIVDDIEFIPADMYVLEFLISNNLSLSEVKRFQFKKCFYILIDKYILLYDDDYTRFGAWYIEDILSLNNEESKDLRLNGRFNGTVELEAKYGKSHKTIVQLCGKHISNGFHVKEFKELQEKIREFV